jgi:pseudolysin
LYENLEEELGEVPKDYLKNKKLALRQFKHLFAKDPIKKASVIPLVYVEKTGQAHWAYKVSLFLTPDSKMPAKPTAIVDAVTYKPFIQWNDLKSVQTDWVQGKGYGGNEKTGQILYSEDLPALILNRDPTSKRCFMENEATLVVDAKHMNYCNKRPM